MSNAPKSNLLINAYSITSKTSYANSKNYYRGSQYLSMTAATLKETLYYNSGQLEFKKLFTSPF